MKSLARKQQNGSSSLRGPCSLGAVAVLCVVVAGCAGSQPQADAAVAPVAPPAGAVVSTAAGELPSWLIPNLPVAAEAYYAPDNTHVIAQAQSDKAVKSARGMAGFLTMTFTDAGEDLKLINDTGWDACSYFFPDGKRLVWTSIKDNLSMPLGNWSDWRNYPQGAELYSSDLEGGDVRRLTSNQYYEAEVTVSPNGQWIVFGRMIDGKMDLWRMRPDGTGEVRITNTPDWEEGAPYYLPDNETIMFRAWRGVDYGKKPTPMTIFTIRHDGTDLKPRTFTDDMNWAPYPARRAALRVRARRDGGELGGLSGGHAGRDAAPAHVRSRLRRFSVAVAGRPQDDLDLIAQHRQGLHGPEAARDGCHQPEPRAAVREREDRAEDGGRIKSGHRKTQKNTEKPEGGEHGEI